MAVVAACIVLGFGSLLLSEDVLGHNTPARRELRTIPGKNVNTGNRNNPQQKQKERRARKIRDVNSPAGRDGHKLSVDETKDVLLKVLNGPEGLRLLKEIAAKMDSEADAHAAADDADQSRRLGHLLTVHFPDCVLVGEAECKDAILAELASSPDLYAHIGGFVEFEKRKKRPLDPDDPDHDKVVLKTDSTGTKVIGLNRDCIGKSRWLVMSIVWVIFLCLDPVLSYETYCIHIFSNMYVFLLLQCTILSCGSWMALRLPSGRGIAPLGNIPKNASTANLSVRQIAVT